MNEDYMTQEKFDIFKNYISQRKKFSKRDITYNTGLNFDYISVWVDRLIVSDKIISLGRGFFKVKK
jgi:regulator of sirC expression with transglutaminase-like and TPR domain